MLCTARAIYRGKQLSGRASRCDAMVVGSREEWKCLFNDALNTLYLPLYKAWDKMVKDHSDSDRRNPLPQLHGILFPVGSKESFYPTDRILHTTGIRIVHASGWNKK